MSDWYLTVRNDNTVADPFVANTAEPTDFDIWPVVSGQPLHNWNYPLTLQASSGEWDGDPDDVLQNALGIPIYSRRLQIALAKEGFANIQFLPVHVLRPDMSMITGFAIANILTLVACLNWKKSEYRRHPRFEGECSGITKIVLVQTAVKGLELFRMKEFQLNLIVSTRFKETFERGNFTGYSFAQVQAQ